MGRILVEKDVEAAIRGGSVFACGGGGWIEHGRMLGLAAVNAGQPELVSIEEVADEAIIATAAAIGAPAGTTAWQMLGIDYVNAVKLVQKELGQAIYGLMVGQNGKSSTLNAWLPGAILGTKVIDAVGDMRAHPTGDMGAIGMANSPLPMIQAAVGGNRSQNAYIEMVAKGATARISPVLRAASDMSGGFIASCRNPLPAAYVKRHAAWGGISKALTLGEKILEAEKKGGKATVDAIVTFLDGEIIASGKVFHKKVAYTSEAFDVGKMTVGHGRAMVTLHIMNEYMAVDDKDGQRISSFPDIITTLSIDGYPLSVGEIKEGMEILVLSVNKNKFPLSSSVMDPSVYPPVERILGIDLASYALSSVHSSVEL